METNQPAKSILFVIIFLFLSITALGKIIDKDSRNDSSYKNIVIVKPDGKTVYTNFNSKEIAVDKLERGMIKFGVIESESNLFKKLSALVLNDFRGGKVCSFNGNGYSNGEIYYRNFCRRMY